MAITDRKITTFATNIVDLSDTPNKDGITADQLKALFDGRTNEEIKTSINGIVDDLVAVADGVSGADQIGATLITDLTGATIQALLESIRNKLKDTTDGTSGADFVNATAIEGLTGTTVQSLLEAIKTYLDLYNTNHKLSTSTDHDNRYYTEAEINLTDGVKGSNLIGTPAIVGVNGTTVKDQLASIKDLINQGTLGQIADGSITDAKLGAGIKVGSLPSLTTTAKTNVVGAINEVNTLKVNATDMTTALALKANATDITASLLLKADLLYTDTQIASVASGSPKAVYATAAALTSAIPAGNTNIYLVTADGKWYYWNGSAWAAGGVYQGTSLAAASTTLADTGNLFVATNVEAALAETANIVSTNAAGINIYGYYNKYPYDATATIFKAEYQESNAQKISVCIKDVKLYDALDTYDYHIESTYLNGTLNSAPYTQIAIKGVKKDGTITARAFLYTDISASHTGIEVFTLTPQSGFKGYAVVTVDFSLLPVGTNAAPTLAQCKLSDYCHVKKEKKRILIVGDSWSDTDPAHTTYTKWPELIENNGNYECINYAQNGSAISGDTPTFGVNGNVLGQVNKIITDKVANVDTVIIMGGINDFRQTVSAPYVYNKLITFYNTFKTMYPNARIIYIANNQLYVTQQQIDYFTTIVNVIRQTVGFEAFTTFGWVSAINYIEDLVHPNDDGYKALCANILSILNGGNVIYYTNRFNKNVKDGSNNDLYTIDLIEHWDTGFPVYSVKLNATGLSLGTVSDISISASDANFIASVPFAKILNKAYITALGKPYSMVTCDCAETFTTTSRVNTTNNIKVLIANANSGIYLSDNYN